MLTRERTAEKNKILTGQREDHFRSRVFMEKRKKQCYTEIPIVCLAIHFFLINGHFEKVTCTEWMAILNHSETVMEVTAALIML